MIILSIHPGTHDAAAVLFDEGRVVAAVQQERLTRVKGDGVSPQNWAWSCADEVLSIAGLGRRDIDVLALSRGLMPRPFFRKNQTLARRLLDTLVPSRQTKRPFRHMDQALREAHSLDVGLVFDSAAFAAASGLRSDVIVHYTSRNLAHALPALYFTDWDEALIYTCAGGDGPSPLSARSYRNGQFTDLIGGDELADLASQEGEATPSGGYGASIGLAYGLVTELLGFQMMRHEGKVTGLAASGKPHYADALAQHFVLLESGAIACDWPDAEAMHQGLKALFSGASKADIASSAQAVLEHLILGSVRRLLAAHPHRRLGLSGGVFANVALNRVLAEHSGADEVFIVPAMGAEGLALGPGLDFLLARDGLEAWAAHRYRLDGLFWGRDYGPAIDQTLLAAPGIHRVNETPIPGAAVRLSQGKIGALFDGRMEFGPRALGARSILVSPARWRINDTLNSRLGRSEFMPFAPVVSSHRASEVFDITPTTAYACRFMTVTTAVHQDWLKRIPAAVHLDGSARPQIIDRAQAPLYYDLLQAFEEQTTLPVLVNTSFNAHEEPIINSPAEAVTALRNGAVDFIITANGLYEAKP
jgi:carbamoyltransferase